MSWNALPWWVYEVTNEQHIAKMQCCFFDEWYSGTSKVLPEHVQCIHPSNFASHEAGGWNADQKPTHDFRQLKESYD